MTDDDRLVPGDASSAPPRGEPRPSRLHQLLKEQPEARSRLVRAVAALLGTALVGLAALGVLLIWHVVRRGRLIRERLGPPRIVRFPELPDREVDRYEEGHGEVSTT